MEGGQHPRLKGSAKGGKPKALVEELGEGLLAAFSADELAALENYLALLEKEAATSAQVKDAQEALLAKVAAQYGKLTVSVIRGQNMSGKWVSGNFVFVAPAKAKSLEANLARPGDLVFTPRGTLGQVSLVPEKPFESYLVSQSQMKLSVSREAADPLFFFYVFISEHQQELIRGRTIQTGVPHINLGILRAIPVQLPPLPEQRAIAGVLSDMDAELAVLEQRRDKTRALKQGMMQELLTGRVRLR